MTDDFLVKIAKKVSKWILDEAIMNRFREQVESFYEALVKWYRPRTEKEGVGPPGPMERLALPPVYANNEEAHIAWLIEQGEPRESAIPYDKEKSLQADYVLLTIIHDETLKNPRTPMISKGLWPNDVESVDNPDFEEGVLDKYDPIAEAMAAVEEKYQEICKGYRHGSKKMQAFIEDALMRVEADLKLPEVPPLTEDELKVLNYLVEQFPQVKYQSDIEAGTGITRKTVGSSILPTLRRYGLVEMPKGKNKGNVATEKGKAYVEKYFS